MLCLIDRPSPNPSRKREGRFALPRIHQYQLAVFQRGDGDARLAGDGDTVAGDKHPTVVDQSPGVLGHRIDTVAAQRVAGAVGTLDELLGAAIVGVNSVDPGTIGVLSGDAVAAAGIEAARRARQLQHERVGLVGLVLVRPQAGQGRIVQLQVGVDAPQVQPCRVVAAASRLQPVLIRLVSGRPAKSTLVEVLTPSMMAAEVPSNRSWTLL